MGIDFGTIYSFLKFHKGGVEGLFGNAKIFCAEALGPHERPLNQDPKLG